MEWEECLEMDVTRAPKNRETAKALLKLCNARLEVAKNIDKKKFPALLAEAYYEVIKELMTALLSLEGFKSYSHVCLISFMKKFYSSEFSNDEMEIIDKLRKIRNNLDYRGIFTGADFMERNEGKVTVIIRKLKEIVANKTG